MSPVCLVFEFLGGDYHLQEVLFNIYYNNVRVRASVYIEIIWFFFFHQHWHAILLSLVDLENSLYQVEEDVQIFVLNYKFL